MICIFSQTSSNRWIDGFPLYFESQIIFKLSLRFPSKAKAREKREKEIKYENVKITQRIFNVENSGSCFQKAAVRECWMCTCGVHVISIGRGAKGASSINLCGGGRNNNNRKIKTFELSICTHDEIEGWAF